MGCNSLILGFQKTILMLSYSDVIIIIHCFSIWRVIRFRGMGRVLTLIDIYNVLHQFYTKFSAAYATG